MVNGANLKLKMKYKAILHLVEVLLIQRTFTTRRTESKEVDLTALTVLTCDPRLTLALAASDITLTVCGANRVAVASGETNVKICFKTLQICQNYITRMREREKNQIPFTAFAAL